MYGTKAGAWAVGVGGGGGSGSGAGGPHLCVPPRGVGSRFHCGIFRRLPGLRLTRGPLRVCPRHCKGALVPTRHHPEGFSTGAGALGGDSGGRLRAAHHYASGSTHRRAVQRRALIAGPRHWHGYGRSLEGGVKGDVGSRELLRNKTLAHDSIGDDTTKRVPFLGLCLIVVPD